MRTLSRLPIAALAAVACSAATPQTKSTPPAATSSALPFVEDDWPRALAEAKARKVPVFVDVWAPW